MAENSLTIIDNDLYHKRGDTASLVLGITLDGTPYTPVDGDIIRFSVREAPNSEDYLIGPKQAVNNTITFTNEDTAELDYGDYWYDIECNFVSTGKRQTYGPYRYHLLPDITR